jgi:hypothetical protein
MFSQSSRSLDPIATILYVYCIYMFRSKYLGLNPNHDWMQKNSSRQNVKKIILPYRTVLFYPLFWVRIRLNANPAPALTIYLNAAPDPVFVITLEEKIFLYVIFFPFLNFTLLSYYLREFLFVIKHANMLT